MRERIECNLLQSTHTHTINRLHTPMATQQCINHAANVTFLPAISGYVWASQNIIEDKKKTQARQQLAAPSLSLCTSLPTLPRPAGRFKLQLLFAGIVATTAGPYKSGLALRIPFSATFHLIQCTSRVSQQKKKM